MGTKHNKFREVSSSITNPNGCQTNRRTLLKGSLIGTSAIAASTSEWVKPLVNAVVLPAHAQTSTPLASTYFGVGSLTGGRSFAEQSLLDLFIVSANAQSSGVAWHMSAEATSGGNYTVCMIFELSDGAVVICGPLNTDGREGVLELTENNCSAGASAMNARIVTIEANKLVIELNYFGADLLEFEIADGEPNLPQIACAE